MKGLKKERKGERKIHTITEWMNEGERQEEEDVIGAVNE